MSSSTVELMVSSEPVSYLDATEKMQSLVEQIYTNQLQERVWFLEHPSLYSAGTSADAQDVLHPVPFPIYSTGRGGQLTYHGPGQRIIYLMLDLRKRGKDLRHYIFQLEEWIIQTLADFNIKGERRLGRVGIWIADPERGEAKIAAIGVRIQKWITLHGIALNYAPNLDHFSYIVPCGLTNFGVTSLEALKVNTTLAEVDKKLIKSFPDIFGSALRII